MVERLTEEQFQEINSMKQKALQAASDRELLAEFHATCGKKAKQVNHGNNRLERRKLSSRKYQNKRLIFPNPDLL